MKGGLCLYSKHFLCFWRSQRSGNQLFLGILWTGGVIQMQVFIWRLKSRDLTLSTKVPIVKTMVFPIVMYGCESCIIKKAEHQRIDVFELWRWRRLLRVPWTTRSNQSVPKEINPEYSLEVLMLKLKLNTLTDAKTWLIGIWFWENWRQKEQGRQRMKWLHSISNSMDMNLSKLGDSEGPGSLACSCPWGCRIGRSNWTTRTSLFVNYTFFYMGFSFFTLKIFSFIHSFNKCLSTCYAPLSFFALEIEQLLLLLLSRSSRVRLCATP